MQLHFAIKYSLSMFFTTALMTLAVEAIEFQNYFKHKFGVIEEESIMFFMTTFLVPLIWLINPFDIYIKLRRKYYMGSRTINQKKANHIMEDFHYDIGKRYAEILKVMWFTVLYVTIVPLGTFLSILGLGLYYWVDKYNLLNRSSVKDSISGKMGRSGAKLLDLILVFKPAGELLFDLQLRLSFSWSTVVQLAFGIAFFFLPWTDFLAVIEGDEYQLAKEDYNDIKDDFSHNYYTSHPIYKYLHTAEATKQN